MIRKNRLPLLFALFSFATATHTMQDPKEKQEEQEIVTPRTSQPQSRKQKVRQASSSSSSQKDFYGTPIKLLKTVYEQAPQKIKVTVEHLKNPAYLGGVDGRNSKKYRALFFVGEPGTGKTTLAKAIAYESKRFPRFIPAMSLLGEYRNQTAINLTKEFNTSVAITKLTPIIIVIDELHRLLENYDSKHHDTDSSATALWTFLDSQYGNHNFFLIGTMNRADKIPQPLKSRILARYIKLSPVNSIAYKRLIFLDNLISSQTQISEEVSSVYLDKILKALPTATGRELEELALETVIVCREQQKSDFCITICKTHIEEALKRINFAYQDMKYDKVEETQEEREERRHQEALDQRDLHFIQQQKIQMTLLNGQITKNHQAWGIYDRVTRLGSNPSYVDESKQGLTKEAQQEVMSYLSEKQKLLYKKMQ